MVRLNHQEVHDNSRRSRSGESATIRYRTRPNRALNMDHLALASPYNKMLA